jgi:hypothetical protein
MWFWNRNRGSLFVSLSFNPQTYVIPEDVVTYDDKHSYVLVVFDREDGKNQWNFTHSSRWEFGGTARAHGLTLFQKTRELSERTILLVKTFPGSFEPSVEILNPMTDGLHAHITTKRVPEYDDD